MVKATANQTKTIDRTRRKLVQSPREKNTTSKQDLLQKARELTSFWRHKAHECFDDFITALGFIDPTMHSYIYKSSLKPPSRLDLDELQQAQEATLFWKKKAEKNRKEFWYHLKDGIRDPLTSITNDYTVAMHQAKDFKIDKNLFLSFFKEVEFSKTNCPYGGWLQIELTPIKSFKQVLCIDYNMTEDEVSCGWAEYDPEPEGGFYMWHQKELLFFLEKSLAEKQYKIIKHCGNPGVAEPLVQACIDINKMI
tara:strand:+ start:218 stop:973 length:756 start_codon:yes stop_codon:yes gene_type:complete